MGLDMSKLKNFKHELEEKSSGIWLFQNKLTPEYDARMLPPLENMGGVYFVRKKTYTLGKKSIVCPSSLGYETPIPQLVEAAKNSGDPEIIKLMKNRKEYREREEYVMPYLELKPILDEDTGQLIGQEVIKERLLCATSQLTGQINDIITGRNYQNGTKEGILHRVKGRNMLWSKQGELLDTEYKAEAWPIETEIEEKWYIEESRIDVVQTVEEIMLSDDEIIAEFNSFFYGNPSGPRQQSRSSSRITAEPAQPRAMTRNRPVQKAPEPEADPAPVTRQRAAAQPAQEDPAPQRTRTQRARTVEEADVVDEETTSTGRSLSDDVQKDSRGTARNMLSQLEDDEDRGFKEVDDDALPF